MPFEVGAAVAWLTQQFNMSETEAMRLIENVGEPYWSAREGRFQVRCHDQRPASTPTPPPGKRWPVERTTPPVAIPAMPAGADVGQFIDSTDKIIKFGDEWAGYPGVPAELRVKVAMEACELLDGGAQMGDAGTYIVGALDDRRENASYLAAWFAQDAVMTFCPRHSDKLGVI